MFYAVYNGKNGNGIYKDWPSCEAEVKGVSKVRYKKFKTEKEAVDFIEACKNDNESRIVYDEVKINYPCAFVDGSINTTTMTPGWGMVFCESEDNVIQECGSCSKFKDTRNIIGELTAALKALQYAKDMGIGKITIYHDYMGISEWATGAWSSDKSAAAKYYVSKFKEFDIDVEFVHVNAHTNIHLNDLADTLAKRGCGL